MQQRPIDHHVTLLFGALCLSAIAAAGYGPQRLNQTKVERLLSIGRSLPTKHKLLTADRELVESATSDADIVVRHSAILVLGIAAEQKLYPRQKLLDTIETGILKTKDSDTSFYLGDYRAALQLPAPHDTATYRNLISILSQHRWSRTIDPEERRIVSELLSSASFRQHLPAAKIFVAKESLDKDSYLWMTGLIKGQLTRSTGNLASYWKFVLRVVASKNPKSNR